MRTTATEIDALELRVSENTKDASDGISKLAASLRKLKKATEGGLGLSAIAKETKELSDSTKDGDESISKFTSIADALKKLGRVKFATDISAELTKIGESLKAFAPESVAQLNATADAMERISKIKGNIPKISDPNTKPQVTEKIKKPATFAGSETLGMIKDTVSPVISSGIDAAKKKTEGLKDALSALAASHKGLRVLAVGFNGIKVGATGAKKIITSFVHDFQKLASGANSVRKRLGSMFANTKLGQTVAGLNKRVGGLFRSFARIAGYRAIRFFFSQLTGAMKEGINNLYQYSNALGGTFASSMDRLATSALYLKNSLGAMASPIINALAPAVDFLIDKFVTLLNVINQFFARLSGASVFTKAKKQATSYGKAAAGAGSATKKAAKEIKDATLGIDELNIISPLDNADNGGGGGGGGALDTSGMFETANIDSGIKDFTDQLKEKFDAGDWKGLGELLGNKFNEVVDMVDWGALGSKLGYSFNGVVTTLYSFLSVADMHKVGSHVGEFINGALAEVDFSTLGRLTTRFATAFLDFIIGAVQTIDWALVGKSFGDYWRGVFDEWSDFFDKYDWNKLGQDLYNDVKNFIVGVDFASLAESFFTAFGKALGAGVAFVGGFIQGAVKDIGEYFSKEIEAAGGNIPLGLWNGIINGLGNIGGWIIEHIFNPFIEGFKSVFGIHSPSTVMEELGNYIVDGLKEGLLSFPSKIADTVIGWGNDLVKWFTGGEGGKNIVERFKESAGDIVSNFKDKIGSTYENCRSNITTWAANVVGWFKDKASKGEFQNVATDAINSFKDKIGSTYETVKTNITTWGGKVVEWFKEKASKGEFQNVASDAISSFKDKIGSAYTEVKANILTWGSKVVEWFKGEVNNEAFAGVANDAVDGFDDEIGSSYTDTKANIEFWGNKVKEWFNLSSYGGVNNVNWAQFASDTINGFKTKIGNAYSTVKGNVMTWAGKVKEWFTHNSQGAVNSNTFSGYANNTITGFKDKIGSGHVASKSNMVTWADHVKTWFSTVATSEAFGGFAKNDITGYSNSISTNHSQAQQPMNTFANNVKTWFENPGGKSLVEQFSNIGKNIINGFLQGVNSLWDTAMRKIREFGKNIIQAGKDGTDEASPSKAFKKIGAFVIEGFNIGVSDMMGSSFKLMDTWTNGIKSYQPVVGFAVDASALDYYNSGSFAKAVRTQASVNNQFTSYSFAEGMEEFYTEYVEPTLKEMASDMKRQADKSEKTVVQVGNRTITDAVTTQEKANGFRFVK